MDPSDLLVRSSEDLWEDMHTLPEGRSLNLRNFVASRANTAAFMGKEEPLLSWTREHWLCQGLRLAFVYKRVEPMPYTTASVEEYRQARVEEYRTWWRGLLWFGCLFGTLSFFAGILLTFLLALFWVGDFPGLATVFDGWVRMVALFWLCVLIVREYCKDVELFLPSWSIETFENWRSARDVPWSVFDTISKVCSRYPEAGFEVHYLDCDDRNMSRYPLLVLRLRDGTKYALSTLEAPILGYKD